LAIYMKAIGRYLDIVTFVDGKPPARATSSLVGYGRAMAHAATLGKARRWGRPRGWASDALLVAARYLDSDEERKEFVRLAEQAFDHGWSHIVGDSTDYVYWNAKTTSMNFTGGGEWLYYRAHPDEVARPGPPRRKE